jgi:hypothetical protein
MCVLHHISALAGKVGGTEEYSCLGKNPDGGFGSENKVS